MSNQPKESGSKARRSSRSAGKSTSDLAATVRSAGSTPVKVDKRTIFSFGHMAEATSCPTSSSCAQNVTESPTAQNELTAHIGKIVKYYREGWRYGTLRKLTKVKARIEHPVTGAHWIDIEDVRAI